MSVSSSKVAYGQVSFKADFKPCLENVKRANGFNTAPDGTKVPYVDAIIVIEDDKASFTKAQRAQLEKNGATVVKAKWGDNFPAFRNASLDEARKAGANWMLVSDSDEHFNENLYRDLKGKIIPALEKQGFNTAGVRCYDSFDAIDWWDDLDSLKELPGGSGRESTWYKQLLFRLYPDMNYEGVGIAGNVHEVWGSKSAAWKATNLPSYTFTGPVDAFQALNDVTNQTETYGPFIKGSGADNLPKAKLEELKQKGLIEEAWHYVHRKSSLRIWRNACLTPESEIITKDGMKAIADVKVGEYVYSGDGKFHQVLDTWKRPYKGKIVNLRTHYGWPIRLTPDHKVMALSARQAFKVGMDKGANRTSGAHDYKPEWVEAQSCSGEMFAFTKPDTELVVPTNIPVARMAARPEGRRVGIDARDNDFWYFVGFWLAEGSFAHSDAFRWTGKDGVARQMKYIELSIHEDDRAKARITGIIEGLFNRKATVSAAKDNHGIKITFGHAELHDYLLQTFGRGASGKRIPMEFLGLQKRYLVSMIEGLMDGDGTRNNTGWSLSTSNKSFVPFLALALAKYNIVASIVPVTYKTPQKIEHKKPNYHIQISGPEWDILQLSKKGFKYKTVNKMCWNDSKYIYVPAYTGVYKEEDYEGDIHDLTVEGAESFATPYMILHNSRNLFMGGGGDSVSDLNRMFPELRTIAREDLKLDDWTSFEQYILSRKPLPPRLIDWLNRALTFSASDYGTETRELAKWVIWYHRELLDDQAFKHGIENPPIMTEREKIESEVRKFYFLILHRHPDRKGLDAYVADILDKKIPLEKLPELLKNSKEYRDKFGGVVPENKEDIHEQIGVDAIVHLTETNVLSALMRSNLFRQLLKPRMDLGKFIESQTVDRDLYPKFYEMREKGELTLEKLLELIKV